MAELTKAAFKSKWDGLFADNSSRAISEQDMRDFMEDIKDSFESLLDNVNISADAIPYWNVAQKRLDSSGMLRNGSGMLGTNLAVEDIEAGWHVKAPAPGTEMYRVDANDDTRIFEVGDGNGVRVFGKKMPLVVEHRNAAIAHTGTTSETTLATIAVPAGLMGTNSSIWFHVFWKGDSSTNGKTLRLRIDNATTGVVHYEALINAADKAFNSMVTIHNDDAANAQKNFNKTGTMGLGDVADIVTSAVDTSAAFNLYITGELENAGDTMTLESYQITLIP